MIACDSPLRLAGRSLLDWTRGRVFGVSRQVVMVLRRGYTALQQGRGKGAPALLATEKNSLLGKEGRRVGER